MTTPEPDRRHETAVATVAHLLAGRLLPGMDAEYIARQALDLLQDQGWRYVRRSDRIPDQGRKDPATAHRGAAEVRKALREALNDEGDS